MGILTHILFNHDFSNLFSDLFMFPIILGFTLTELLVVITLRSCEIFGEHSGKQKADVTGCEGQDLFLLNELTDLATDPLTPIKCVNDIIGVALNEFELEVDIPEIRTETTVDIGDWDIDSIKTISVPHTIADISDIVSVKIDIRDDNLNITHSFFYTFQQGIWVGIDATNILLDVTGITDLTGTDYDETPFNRGWISIIHT